MRPDALIPAVSPYERKPEGVASAMARRFANDAARGLQSLGNEAADTAVRLMRKLREAGVSPTSLGHVHAAISDALRDIQGGITKELDDVKQHEDQHKLDLSEWEAIEVRDMYARAGGGR
jgi:hypothetical protein